jgi:DNA-directed RNA polymerase subunit N (RpoN/RPB10)
MIIPVRCFTCNNLIAHKWEIYLSLIKSGLTEAEALDKIEFRRYCCRRMFLSHVNIGINMSIIQNTHLINEETVD